MNDDGRARRALLHGLAAVVGESHVVTDPAVRRSYEVDWTRRYSGEAAAVVRPANADEIARVVGLTRSAGVAIVPQGGNTGLVGGAVPRGGQIVLSLRRLAGLGDVDREAGRVTVGGGVTVEALQEHAAAGGLHFGVDLASRASATVGGLAATNAGGIHTVRYGRMRVQVVGLTAVLGTGEIVRTSARTASGVVGYDLGSLLVGSEGTLGVITELELRLHPRAHETAVAVVACDGIEAAVVTVRHVQAAIGDHLHAAELFFDDGLRMVTSHFSVPPPFERPYPCYLLIESAAATGDVTEELAGALDGIPSVEDATLGLDAPARRQLWHLRESHTDVIAAAGVPHKLDVGLPIPRLAEFERELRALVNQGSPGARLVLFGHIGVGNLHVNLLGYPPDDETIDDAVLGLVASMDGSIAAEHGVGFAKRGWLTRTQSAEAQAAARAIKRVFDPDGVLNPDVLLSPPAPPTPPTRPSRG